MGLAVGVAKYLVFFFNFIFFITGIAIIAVGGVALSEQYKYEDITASQLTSAPVLLIIVGVFVALISFFGCCGAIKHNYCMLVTFAAILGLIFILELAAGITAYMKKDSIKDGLESAMNKSMENPDNIKTWKNLEIEFHCCGVTGPSDWDTVSTKNSTGGLEGCACEDNDEKVCDKNKHYVNGCFDAMVDFLEDNIVKIGGVGVGIAFIQILGIVFACCLATAVKDSA